MIIFKEKRGQTRIINNLYSTRTGKRELNILMHTITFELHTCPLPPFAPASLDCCAIDQHCRSEILPTTPGWGIFSWNSSGITPLLMWWVFLFFFLYSLSEEIRGLVRGVAVVLIYHEGLFRLFRASENRFTSALAAKSS